jgi:hypothetical protein
MISYMYVGLIENLNGKEFRIMVDYFTKPLV